MARANVSRAWMRARPGTKSSSRSATLNTASASRATTANWYMSGASLVGFPTHRIGPPGNLPGNACYLVPTWGSAPSRYVGGKTGAQVRLGRRVHRMASYEGYCVKCREKRTFDGQEVELANGRRAAQGTCPVCGTKMNRMLGKK